MCGQGNGNNNFNNLPDEIKGHISSFTDNPTFGNLRLTNSSINESIMTDWNKLRRLEHLIDNLISKIEANITKTNLTADTVKAWNARLRELHDLVYDIVRNIGLKLIDSNLKRRILQLIRSRILLKVARNSEDLNVERALDQIERNFNTLLDRFE